MTTHISLLCQVKAGVAWITLDRPDQRNALDIPTLKNLHAVLDEFNADPSVRVVVLTGSGRSFCSGADLAEWADAEARGALESYGWTETAHALMSRLYSLEKPTIAAINGTAVGAGMDLTLCCDLRIAGESSRFGAPINKLGFSMYPGEMAGLLGLVGPAVLLDILLAGRILSAREALAKGLLTRVVDDEEVEKEALATVARILKGAPLVARWHKQWVHRLMTGQPLSSQEKREAFDFLATEDYKEGLDAFFTKRTPVFKGR